MQSILIYVPTILAVALIVTRYVRVLEPVLAWLPPRWRWLPGAVTAVAGLLTLRLPGATDAATVGEVLLEAAVIFALAMQAGMRAPDAPATGATAAAKTTIASLLVLALMLIAVGCAPSLQASMAARAPANTSAAQPAASQQTRCRRLNRTESALRWTSRTAGVIAGGSGLSTIPIDDQDARAALAITAGVAGVTAAVTEALRAEAAADFIEEGCQ
jgi:hypothetical protein